MKEREGLAVLKNNFLEKELLLRILSSIVLILLALSFNYLGNYYFLFVVFIINIILLKEFYNLYKLKLINKSFFVNSFIASLNLLFIFYKFYLLAICFFSLGLLLSYALEKKNWKVIILGYFYLSVPLLLLLDLNNNTNTGKVLIFWTFIIVWTTDISAFFFGRLIKGPKLWPYISPNKTWSGFISSIIIAIIFSGLFSLYYDFINIFKAIYVGFIVSLFSNLGDLFESWLKRLNSIKDTSKLIPGHGGLLDRLDGFLFAIVTITLIT